jgi:hypothetical protein
MESFHGRELEVREIVPWKHVRSSMEEDTEEVNKKRKKLTSYLWEFFQQEGREHAKCLSCNVVVPTKNGTASMKHHYEHNHMDKDNSTPNKKFKQLPIQETKKVNEVLYAQ